MANLPVADFLEARLKEYDPTFDVRKGTAFHQLFFAPMQFIMQPLIDEAVELGTGQSFLKILKQENPDAFPEERVDALVSNYFIDRDGGGNSVGVVRVYYAQPVNREWPATGTVFSGSNGKNYTNPGTFFISRDMMSLNIENGMYYYDIPIVSNDLGEDTVLDAEGLVGLDNDPDALYVLNSSPLKGGRYKETNKELITRARKSIAIRDLVTGKGFNATMFENFGGSLTEIKPIGFGDPEMMRDILFNAHVGGRIDGYFKTAAITPGFKNIVGLLPDYTRQTYGSTNLQLSLVEAAAVPDGNFDVANSKRPVVSQIRPVRAAQYTSPVAIPTAINLTTANRIRIGVAGQVKEIKIAGATASTTTRAEIINHINGAFGYILVTSVGANIKITSPVKSADSYISLLHPEVGGEGASALSLVFGLDEPSSFYGEGPIVFKEDYHYDVNPTYGTITRVLGAFLVEKVATGDVSSGVAAITDPTTDIFLNVVAGDIVTINPDSILVDDLNDPPATLSKDFRVVANEGGRLVLDEPVGFTSSSAKYCVRRTGIKTREVVLVEYWFNPLSIDIGPLVNNTNTLTGEVTRGVRPGRYEQTITDVSFLRINKIEIIDPITYEPTGEVLATGGGYGEGGYGEGPYGIGSSSDYYMIVNSPEERFSAFEDSLIVLHPSLAGLSFRVDYDYVPECVAMHNFVRSESERVIDGDILMKHFVPAYVSGTIQYKIDSTDATVPTNESLTESLKNFITIQSAGTDLSISDVYQYLARATDPYDRYGSYIKPFTLSAFIYNMDGTTTVISSDDKLVVPTPSPFPKYTTCPLSPRITHWIADNIVLERIS